MGCCESGNKSAVLSQSGLCEKLIEALDSGSLKRVSIMLQILNKKSKNNSLSFIDEEITQVKGKTLNAMAYCLYNGSEKLFKYLFEKGASLKSMESLLESQKTRAINIICHKGHLKLLIFYLPLYLRDYNSLPLSEKSYTIDLKDSDPDINSFELAIHSACRSGMVQIVSYLYNYFKDKSYCPKEFSMNSVNEYYGEDCALISCRFGCFPLVKFLFEVCAADFTKLNKCKENAIMICVCGHQNSPNFSYLECISYLVEIVKLDITYMYEETLVLAEDEEIHNYLVMQLRKIGIEVKEEKIEKVEFLNQGNFEGKDNSKDSIFTQEVTNFLQSSYSIPSSISELPSKNIEGSYLDFIDLT